MKSFSIRYIAGYNLVENNIGRYKWAVNIFWGNEYRNSSELLYLYLLLVFMIAYFGTQYNLDEKGLMEQLNYFEHKRIPRIVYAEKAIGNVLYILYEGANINLGRK